MLSTTQKLQQDCAVLVCIVILCQSTWRRKMQHPVALFQKRSQIQNFGTKCLFMISAGCLFPSLIYPWTICKLKRTHTVFPLCWGPNREQQCLKLVTEATFPSAASPPARSPSPHHYLWQLSKIPGFCRVPRFVFLLDAFLPRRSKWSPEDSRAWRGKDEATRT